MALCCRREKSDEKWVVPSLPCDVRSSWVPEGDGERGEAVCRVVRHGLGTEPGGFQPQLDGQQEGDWNLSQDSEEE